MVGNPRGVPVGMQLHALMQRIDPEIELAHSAERLVSELVMDFVKRTAEVASSYAKHRGSARIEAQDLRLCLKKQWDISIPGVAEAKGRRQGVDLRELSRDQKGGDESGRKAGASKRKSTSNKGAEDASPGPAKRAKLS